MDASQLELLIELIDGRDQTLATEVINKVAGGGSPGISGGQLGYVSIPLASVFKKNSCDGWHLLQGCDGEVRVGWLLLAERPALHSLPSPSAFLQSKMEQKVKQTLPALCSVSFVAVSQPCGTAGGCSH